MPWHPTLSRLESKPDQPWDRPRQLTDTQWREIRLETIGTFEECWCGMEKGHSWKGKASGAPHPRNRSNPIAPSPPARS